MEASTRFLGTVTQTTAILILATVRTSDIANYILSFRNLNIYIYIYVVRKRPATAHRSRGFRSNTHDTSVVMILHLRHSVGEIDPYCVPTLGFRLMHYHVRGRRIAEFLHVIKFRWRLLNPAYSFISFLFVSEACMTSSCPIFIRRNFKSKIAN